MELILESNNLEDYLGEIPPAIRFDTPLVKEKIEFINKTNTQQVSKDNNPMFEDELEDLDDIVYDKKVIKQE